MHELNVFSEALQKLLPVGIEPEKSAFDVFAKYQYDCAKKRWTDGIVPQTVLSDFGAFLFEEWKLLKSLPQEIWK